WGEGNVTTGLIQNFQIGIQISWVVAEVLWVIKLRGIYENTNDHQVAFPACLLHQRHVPLMQSSHGGNKSYNFSGRFGVLYLLPNLTGSGQYLHRTIRKC